ncbi:hypothetical protein C2G38_2192591 [Gigaspora rosea]|uniref:Uncharacterized protein n=1 Tax=Gigaspora rosea TaxID=44941 RepID=A0A397V055_9GLOM|nr:hypothetical protein C2G38_2192591 [Gigaspora rosea]
MSNVHTLKDIKNRGHRFGIIRESELENALHSSIKFASDFANEYKDLQAVLTQKASSLDKDKILYLKDEIDKLKAEVEELELEKELERTSHDSDTTSFRDKISELNSLNCTLEQKRDDLNSKTHKLEAEVDLSHKSNKIGGAKADPDLAENFLEKKSLPQETNTHLAEQISKASSEFNEVIGGDSRPEKGNEITSPEITSVSLNSFF